MRTLLLLLWASSMTAAFFRDTEDCEMLELNAGNKIECEFVIPHTHIDMPECRWMENNDKWWWENNKDKCVCIGTKNLCSKSQVPGCKWDRYLHKCVKSEKENPCSISVKAKHPLNCLQQGCIWSFGETESGDECHCPASKKVCQELWVDGCEWLGNKCQLRHDYWREREKKNSWDPSTQSYRSILLRRGNGPSWKKWGYPSLKKSGYYSYYSIFKKMDHYSPAIHLGEINRGYLIDPEIYALSDRSFGAGADFNPDEFV